jgi:hypothetical protein
MIWVRLEWEAEQRRECLPDAVCSKDKWGSAAETACPVTTNLTRGDRVDIVLDESPVVQQTTNRGAA